ncbi:hypothetical protein L7F22_011147 [Adiantum nelumboides]|nr:hypothetical protein [Adiantum nelumboides]
MQLEERLKVSKAKEEHTLLALQDETAALENLKQHINTQETRCVFSFRVVLLELLRGRKPIDKSVPLGQESLVVWTMPLLCSGLNEFVDPTLRQGLLVDDVQKMAYSAWLCLQMDPGARPNMTIVLQVLSTLVPKNSVRMSDFGLLIASQDQGSQWLAWAQDYSCSKNVNFSITMSPNVLEERRLSLAWHWNSKHIPFLDSEQDKKCKLVRKSLTSTSLSAAESNKSGGHQDKNAEVAKSGGSLKVDQAMSGSTNVHNPDIVATSKEDLKYVSLTKPMIGGQTDLDGLMFLHSLGTKDDIKVITHLICIDASSHTGSTKDSPHRGSYVEITDMDVTLEQSIDVPDQWAMNGKCSRAQIAEILEQTGGWTNWAKPNTWIRFGQPHESEGLKGLGKRRARRPSARAARQS